MACIDQPSYIFVSSSLHGGCIASSGALSFNGGYFAENIRQNYELLITSKLNVSV